MATFNKPAHTKWADVRTRTHEGGQAITTPVLTELAFTAACTFVGQDTFYETAEQREDRLIALIQKAAKAHPGGVVELIKKIRQDFKIRAAAILIAAEFVHAKPGYETRRAVANACWRADEPAEFMAYWINKFGRKIPRGVKLGLGDAARKLYTERNVLKWDSKDRAVRMADVLEICHVKPETPEQSSLFRYMLDTRHRGSDAWDILEFERTRRASDVHLWDFDPNHLMMFRHRQRLMAVPPAERRERARILPEQAMREMAAAGFTWENLSSYLPGGMDTEAWQFAIPQMQVMALIRNLRNFDKAGLSEEWVDRVIAKITSEEDVRASRIFPYQVLTAYRFAESDNWKRALGKTLDHASGNVPVLPRTLFVIDTSGSMQSAVSEKSRVTRVEIAALQAVSVAKHAPGADIVIYGASSRMLRPEEWVGKSLLGAVQYVVNQVGSVGHATFGHTAIASHFNPDRHERAVIFTDDQQHDSGHVDLKHVPQLITFNIGGYSAKSTWGKVGAQTNIQVAGYSDEIFRALVEILKIQ